MATRLHREQLLQVELQAHAEHQQDDAHLRQLFGQVPIRFPARRVRADDDAREQVANDRGQPETLGDVAENQRGREAERQRQDQVQVVHALIW